MKLGASAAILAFLAALSGCSDPAAEGAHGAGGASTTTGGSGTTTTTSSTWTSTSTVTNTTTDCDNSGSCGDMFSGCVECSILNNCAAEMASCQYDAGADCMDYMACIDPCEDQDCRDLCKAGHPDGFELYKDLVICVICEECPIDCDAIGSGCPPPPAP